QQLAAARLWRSWAQHTSLNVPYGHPNRERHAFARDVGDVNCCLMELEQLANERKTEAGRSEPPVQGMSRLREAREEGRHVLLGDPPAIVLDDEFREVLRALGPDAYPSTIRRVLDRVANEVQHNLFQALRVCEQKQAFRQLQLQTNVS